MTSTEVTRATETVPAEIIAAVKAADDKQAVDLIVMDLRKAAGFTDYFDFVVHIFAPETRLFYGLERLWGDATLVGPIA